VLSERNEINCCFIEMSLFEFTVDCTVCYSFMICYFVVVVLIFMIVVIMLEYRMIANCDHCSVLYLYCAF